MAVPAHDERDFQFALKFGLPIVPVIARTDEVAKSQVFPGSMRPGLAEALAQNGIQFAVAQSGDLGEALHVTLHGDEQIDRYVELASSYLLAGYWNEVVGARWAFILTTVLASLARRDLTERSWPAATNLSRIPAATAR